MARPKGSKNKIGVRAKDNVVSVFDRLGGVEGMVKWAQENETEFYKMYAKLIPTDITINEGETAVERLVERFTEAELEQAIATLAGLAEGSSKGKGKAGTPERPDSLH